MCRVNVFSFIGDLKKSPPLLEANPKGYIMTNYCEIFRAGTHKAANGEEKTYTTADLDAIVNNFNADISAPIVIGHPKTNNPAYGWVDSVKREGEKLYASFKQVVPEFSEWVNKGYYKNRSISLYPDMRLRHVGFLGAQPPAVKGLEEFQFSEEEDALTYDFADGNDFKFIQIADIFQNLRDFLIDKFDLETADKIIYTWKIDNLKQIQDMNPAEVQSYCEEFTKESNRKEQQLTKEVSGGQQDPVKTEDFSEQIAQKDTRISELETKLSENETKARKVEYEQFAEQAIKDGHITPAQKPFIVDFCEVCHGVGKYDFAEGGEKSVVENFKEFITGVKQIDFSELPEGESGNTVDFSDPVAVQAAIIEYQAEQSKKGITVGASDALSAIKKNK